MAQQGETKRGDAETAVMCGGGLFTASPLTNTKFRHGQLTNTNALFCTPMTFYSLPPVKWLHQDIFFGKIIVLLNNCIRTGIATITPPREAFRRQDSVLILKY